MSLGPTQDVKLIKWVFMEFFLLFLIAIIYQALYWWSKLKTWYFLFWSYYGLGRLEQNRRLLSLLILEVGCSNNVLNSMYLKFEVHCFHYASNHVSFSIWITLLSLCPKNCVFSGIKIQHAFMKAKNTFCF